MATPEQIAKLKQAEELAGGREQLEAKIKEKGLTSKFVDTFGSQKPTEPVIKPKVDKIEPVEPPKIEEISEPPKPIEPEKQVEPVKPTETIKPTETKVEDKTTETGLPQNIQDWKAQGSDMTTLEEMIETKYGTVATTENGVLTANIGGIDYQWNIDDAGNLIKTKVGGESGKDIFNRLMSGEEFEDTGIKTTKSYITAKKLYDKYNNYKNYTIEDFSSSLKNGSLIKGTKLYEYLMTDPDIKNNIDKATALNKINNEDEIDVETSGQDLTTEVINNPTISNFMSDNNISAEEFGQLTNTPEVIAKGQEVENYKMAVDELQNTYDNIRNEVKNELEGTGASKSQVEAIIAARQEDIRPALNLAIDKYNTAYGTYTDLKSSAIDLFELNLGLYQQQQAGIAEQQATQEKRAYEYGLLQEQRAYDEANIKTEIITDEATGQQALINSQTGEVIKSFDTGLKAGTGTTPTVKNMGTSDAPDWRQYNPTTGQWDTIQTTDGSDFTGDFSVVDFSGNQDLINKYPGEASFKNNNPTGITWGVSSDLKNLWDNAGINYSQGTDRPTAEGGSYVKFDSVQDGLDAYSIALTQRGDDIYTRLQKWVGTPAEVTNKLYAKDLMEKAGIQEGEKFSELDEDRLGLLMEAQLQRESPNFYNELSNLSQVEEEEVKPLTTRQYTQYNQAYSKFVGNPQVKAFEESMSAGGDLIASLKSASGPGDVGAVFQFMKSLDPASVVREGEFAVAARSAGVWEQFKNIPANKIEGAILTDKQRKAFGELAFEYIKNKSKIYDVKYDDFTKILKNQGIPEDYYPTKMSDYIDEFSGEKQDTQDILYTDKDGIEYNKEGLINEIEKNIQEGTITDEQALNWLEQNNLSYILD